MNTCPECNKENPKDADFCNKCGSSLEKNKSKYKIEKNIEHFGEEIENIGEKIEKKGKNIETWYHKKFGFFGPILSSLIAFIVLLIVIRLLAYFGTNKPWMMSIITFLESFLLLFLLVFFLSGFSNYFTKKYRSFRFISPVVGAVVFLIWFWIVINILRIISSNLDVTILGTIADIFELLLIPIAALVLLFGYLGIYLSTTKHRVKESSKKAKTKQKDYRNNEVAYKRLYRSGKDKILGGVCGGFGEYFKIDPVIIRIIFVVGLFVSFGFMVLAYIIFWIIVPRNPNHEW